MFEVRAMLSWLVLLLFGPNCFLASDEATVFPPKGNWSYAFENLASRETIAKLNELVVDHQNWRSEQTGRFKMSQKTALEKHWLLEYELVDLQHKETDRGGPFDWSMKADAHGVEMFLSDQKRESPLVDIAANPFDDFVGVSIAIFDHQGDPVLEKGRLRSAQLRVASADVGQQVFGGLNIEHWAHRCVVPIPKELKAKGSLSRSVNSSVDRLPGSAPLVEFWTMQKHQRGWKIKMKSEDQLPQTSIRELKHPVRNWILKRHLEAWLDDKTFLPLEVTIVEVGSYDEGLLLEEGQSALGRLHLAHRWKNTFKATRK
jgi:hypothetical protein